MSVRRVERVVYGVENLEECAGFFTDLGLDPLGERRFATQAGQVVELRPTDDPDLPPPVQDGPTLREVVWGVDTGQALEALVAELKADRAVRVDADGSAHTVDETGFGVGLAVSAPVAVSADYPAVNRIGAIGRVNQPVAHPGRVRPIRLCHVALDIVKAGKDEAVAFYTDRLGFRPTDRPAQVGVFMRAPGDSDHHTLLLCHRPDRNGINHCAFEVARVDEVIVGANDMIERGWHEARRLGRHTIGSNFFRFIHAPCGGRVELAADMDRVDDSYGPNDYEQTPPHTIFTLKTERAREAQ
ncbi:MAG TPA: VOC family protein [Trebonia sp.]|nr:VOC family protein [Trebonia sp.]